MPKVFLTIFALILASLSISSYAQVDKFIDGTHYTTLAEPLNTSTKDNVEVAGMFWYGCPHCSNLEPVLDQWSTTKPDYVQFVHVPTIFDKRWEFHAKVFYTIQALGIEDKAHQAIFDHIHQNRESLSNKKQLITFLSTNFNQDDALIEKTFNSFGVKSKVGSAKSLTKKSGITFVPAIIIDGKYVTSVSQAGTTNNLLKVINFLAEKSKNDDA